MHPLKSSYNKISVFYSVMINVILYFYLIDDWVAQLDDDLFISDEINLLLIIFFLLVLTS